MEEKGTAGDMDVQLENQIYAVCVTSLNRGSLSQVLPKLETCFYLLSPTQLLNKRNSCPGREEVDGRHTGTSSKLLNWFHSGERKSLGELTAAVGHAIEKM